MKRFSIALDGPSGAGKSTIARSLAERFSCIYVDTGAMYRAVGLFVHRRGVSPADEAGVVALLPELRLGVRRVDGEQRIFLAEDDVSGAIRTPEVSMIASDVSKLPAVRAFLLETQRALAKETRVVMDGRDIGTVVLPDAEIKIFLTATPEDRAHRRYEELLRGGADVTYEEVLADLIRRDENDRNRDIAPLRPADDAILVDTTGFSFETSSKHIGDLIEARLTELSLLDKEPKISAV
ncbi:(d)CMP kinase [Oscillospiraceae bacterium OttesenSCG-928-G22]|nr:(d)CMP kinase [Oscillospiraceae bacterium OttesenSCG-928-G22]